MRVLDIAAVAAAEATTVAFVAWGTLSECDPEEKSEKEYGGDTSRAAGVPAGTAPDPVGSRMSSPVVGGVGKDVDGAVDTGSGWKNGEVGDDVADSLASGTGFNLAPPATGFSPDMLTALESKTL